MEIIPIEYCEIGGDHIHLNRSMASCAFEHNCGESGFNDCPLKPFFFDGNKRKTATEDHETEDMPEFYISDL